LNEITDRFVDQQLQYDPTLSYFTGIPATDHSRFADKSPQAIRAALANSEFKMPSTTKSE